MNAWSLVCGGVGAAFLLVAVIATLQLPSATKRLVEHRDIDAWMRWCHLRARARVGVGLLLVAAVGELYIRLRAHETPGPSYYIGIVLAGVATSLLGLTPSALGAGAREAGVAALDAYLPKEGTHRRHFNEQKAFLEDGDPEVFRNRLRGLLEELRPG